MIYVYFVCGFTCHGTLFNTEVTMTTPITFIEEIRDIQKKLEERPELHSIPCTIINYQLLRTENTEDISETTAE